MTRWERWALNLCTLAIAVTGYAYIWMKYALRSDDPFAVVNHPWQGATLDLHLMVAPVLILIFGIVFSSHVRKKLSTPRLPNRKSGLWSLGTFAVMVLSGYLLQVSSNEAWLQAMVVLHIASGAVFSVTYAAHLIISAKLLWARTDTVVREVA